MNFSASSLALPLSIRFAIIASMPLFALVGCGEEKAATGLAALPAGEGEAVVTVNGEKIASGEFNHWLLRRKVADPSQLTVEQRAAALEEVASLNVLAQEAEKRLLFEVPAVADQLRIQWKSALADALLQNEMEKNSVTESEIAAEYERRKADMATTQIRARHILVASEDQAVALIEQLNSGANFSKLAEEHSTDPSAKEGGDLGWFEARQMVPAFAQAVESIATGRWSDKPIKTDFGWHIIKTEGRREVPAPSLDEMRDQLRTLLNAERVEALITRLREQAKVESASTS